MSILEGMVKNTKFVFHTSQTQSKEEIVLDRQQFSVLGEKKKKWNTFLYYNHNAKVHALKKKTKKKHTKHFNQPKLDLLIQGVLSWSPS